MTAGLPIAILAGGEGRRLGGGKPLRHLGGISLLDRTIAIAARWSSEIVVAGGVVPTSPTIGVMQDDPAIAGPLGGLAAALRHVEQAGGRLLLTLPCDMPFLPTDLPDRLAAGIGGAAAALAASGGHVHPVCGLWRVAALDRLGPYLASGRRSLRGFAEAAGCVAIEWRCEPFDPFLNINTGDELAQAEAMLAMREPRPPKP